MKNKLKKIEKRKQKELLDEHKLGKWSSNVVAPVIHKKICVSKKKRSCLQAKLPELQLSVPKNKSLKQKKGIMTDLISTIAKEALQRGNGRACVATHGSGCRHYGIWDLYPMDAKTFSFYSKNKGWLDDKKCIECHMDTKDMVMDKVSKIYMRYCEMGLKSYKYNKNGNDEEKAAYNDHDCNMILCVPCYDGKLTAYEKEVKEKMGLQSKRCSARNRLMV